MNCKRCGQCCENVALTISPKELEKSYNSWYGNKHNFVEYKQIYLLYPMLEYKGYDKKVKRYRYSCKHLKFERKKAFCTIQKIKPTLCYEYGTNSKLNMGANIASENKKLYPKCVF